METTTISALDIVSRLVTPENVGMSAGIWLILELARRSMPKLFEKGLFKRLLPVLPETMGVLFYWLIPALATQGASVGERLLIGFVIGTGSSKIHSIVRQSILGKDKHIAASKKKAAKADKDEVEAKDDEPKTDEPTGE